MSLLQKVNLSRRDPNQIGFLNTLNWPMIGGLAALGLLICALSPKDKSTVPAEAAKEANAVLLRGLQRRLRNFADACAKLQRDSLWKWDFTVISTSIDAQTKDPVERSVSKFGFVMMKAIHDGKMIRNILRSSSTEPEWVAPALVHGTVMAQGDTVRAVPKGPTYLNYMEAFCSTLDEVSSQLWKELDGTATTALLKDIPAHPALKLNVKDYNPCTLKTPECMETVLTDPELGFLHANAWMAIRSAYVARQVDPAKSEVFETEELASTFSNPLKTIGGLSQLAHAINCGSVDLNAVLQDQSPQIREVSKSILEDLGIKI